MSILPILAARVIAKIIKQAGLTIKEFLDL